MNEKIIEIEKGCFHNITLKIQNYYIKKEGEPHARVLLIHDVIIREDLVSHRLLHDISTLKCKTDRPSDEQIIEIIGHCTSVLDNLNLVKQQPLSANGNAYDYD